MINVSIEHQASHSYSISNSILDLDSGQEFLYKLNKWVSEAIPGESRDTAAARMMDCEIRKAVYLDITGLQLIDLPACLPRSITEIAIDGNRFSADILGQIKENTNAELICSIPVADEVHVPFITPEVMEIFDLQVQKMMTEDNGEKKVHEAILMVKAQRDAISGRGTEQQARVNEKMAKKVFKEVRQAYVEGDKSSNKVYKNNLENDAFPASRRLGAREKIAALTQQWKSNTSWQREVAKTEKLVIDAGNCEFLATASARRVVESGGYAETWRFDRAADHLFAVVGAPPSVQTTDFANWQGIWIIDGWTNIVCEAPAYLEALNKKMKKWDSLGKVTISGSETSSLVASEFLDAINAGVKEQKAAPTPLVRNPWQSFSAEIKK